MAEGLAWFIAAFEAQWALAWPRPRPDMEFCETPHILCPGYQTDLHGVAEHSYPLEVGSDVDTETEGDPCTVCNVK
ncbi:hypothetical protein TURU_155888 [Turdus rufiventris]|nr:hypothetical protein TURU_155888 [Turdus rufiventris]